MLLRRSVPDYSVIHRNVVRTAVAFWLLGWFIKFEFYLPYLFGYTANEPVRIAFFPPFFRNPAVATVFYALPIVTLGVFFIRRLIYARICGLIMAVSALVLMLHIDTYNDATFVTSFWTALWLIWFTAYARREDAIFSRHTRTLIQCIVGLMFLGAVVGKLTPEYWSGQVMADIFFKEQFSSVAAWVAHLPGMDTQLLASWVAKLVIVSELILVLAPLFPYRWLCGFAIPVMGIMPIFCSVWILSVLGCLIGLLLAGLRLERPTKPAVARRRL